MVLGDDGGIVAKMRGTFKAFIGGPLGSGRQYVSWVHWKDVVGALLFAIDTEGFRGPYDVTAPTPATMNELARVFGKVLGRPAIGRVPAFALRLVVGKDVARLILTGQRAVPTRLLEAGYRFEHTALETALRDVLARP